MSENARGRRLKLGTNKNKGYIGYHTTWDGLKVFLRSKAEFIYACVLDEQKIPYKIECCTYIINNRSYKPDFFIFADTNYQVVKKIVEVKGLDDNKTALLSENQFKPYFTSIGILYEVVWKQRSAISKYNLESKIKEWVDKSILNYDNVCYMMGEKNPMFGKKHLDKTKQLISLKAKARQTLEYKEKCRESQKLYWESEAGKVRKAHIAAYKRNLALLKNPIITKTCKYCANFFKVKKLSKQDFCCATCTRRWKTVNIENYLVKNSSNMWRKNLMTTINKIITYYDISLEIFLKKVDYYVGKAKEQKIIPLNKGITINTLEKYNLEKEYKWQN